jgi:hypothetical protein
MIQYEPGEEIQLEVPSKRKFFVKAMSWREQKEYGKLVDAACDLENDTVQTEGVLDAILTRLVRTDPPIELNQDALSAVVDLKLIWELNAAIRMNVTYEEKKS